MQTFLPYSNFTRTAEVLDMKRLGKQRVENLQIIKALTDPEYGWQNHPAVKMWRGYEYALLKYQFAICNEWTGRGYKDTCLDKSIDILIDYDMPRLMPPWIGEYRFHVTHQSNLLRKLPEHYSKYFIGIPDNFEYYWPVK